MVLLTLFLSACISDEQAREMQRKSLAKDNVMELMNVIQDADSEFVFSSIFPQVNRALYDSVYIFKLPDYNQSIYTVTGATFIIIYSALNPNAKQVHVVYYDDIHEDSVFYNKMRTVRIGD